MSQLVAAALPSTVANSYDEVPYKSHPYRQSHPDRLATIATLLGMQPARLDNCRVLELGCASGGNLIPMAEQLPGSKFVGLDFSLRQISTGRDQVQALGLKNVSLEHKDILAAGAELGKFDYIIAHGVYSWVPPAVQNKLLEICSQNLRPQGVAYVSYNTLPGWRMRGVIRDMMVYRARKFQAPADRVRHARGMLDFLTQATAHADNAYGALLKSESKLLADKDDQYLLHDHLEEHNEPLYFHQFAERAQQKQLQYLGEADFRVMSPANFPRDVETSLRNMAASVIEIEQYMDFVRNRMFRQTLLCHRHVPLDRSLSHERIFHLHVASQARPEQPIQDARSSETVKFRSIGGTLTTSEPIVKAAMQHLATIWPQSVPFADLLAVSRSRLHGQTIADDADRAAHDEQQLASAMMRCYSTAVIELSAFPGQCTIKPGRMPEARRLAREQARSAGSVTNTRHETVQLTDLERHVLIRLDGQRDSDALLSALVDLTCAGSLVVRDKGQPITDPGLTRQVLSMMLGQTLERLQQHALLVR